MEDITAPPTLLPNDVLLEVLAHVAMADVAALFRCAAACKRWCGLVTDRSFLRRPWLEDTTHTSALIGFFTQQWSAQGNRDSRYKDLADLCVPPVFAPVPWFVLGPSHRFLTSLVFGAAACLLNGAKPLAACGCFLLLCLGPVTYGADNSRIAVCNPISGTCEILPPLEYLSSPYLSYALVTGEDCGSSSSLFKVLAMGLNVYDGDKLHCDLRVLTSHERSWTTRTECFTEDFGMGWQHCPDAVAVVCGHLARCLFTYIDYNGRSQLSTIDVSAESGRLVLTKLSFPPTMILPSSSYLATVDGKVLVFCFCVTGVQIEGIDDYVETWAQGDDGTHVRARAMKLKPPHKKYPIYPVRSLWCGEKSGTLIVNSRLQLNYEEATDQSLTFVKAADQQFSGMVTEAVPMEIDIDWPSLFMSRLARYA